jgi:hypothetical protein
MFVEDVCRRRAWWTGTAEARVTQTFCLERIVTAGDDRRIGRMGEWPSGGVLGPLETDLDAPDGRNGLLLKVARRPPCLVFASGVVHGTSCL